MQTLTFFFFLCLWGRSILVPSKNVFFPSRKNHVDFDLVLKMDRNKKIKSLTASLRVDWMSMLSQENQLHIIIIFFIYLFIYFFFPFLLLNKFLSVLPMCLFFFFFLPTNIFLFVSQPSGAGGSGSRSGSRCQWRRIQTPTAETTGTRKAYPSVAC